jgi:hypothetical protein
VEDHHVDRPDVEARQRVKLTGTNRSTGLIALIAKARDLICSKRESVLNKNRASARAGVRPCAPFGCEAAHPERQRKTSFASFQTSDDRRQTTEVSFFCSPSSVLRRPNPFLAGLVALSKAIRPDPIPNSAVKRLSADGTLS